VPWVGWIPVKAGSEDRREVVGMWIPGNSQAERRSFVRHYLEMVGAMVAGMVVLGGAVSLFCAVTGHQDLFDHVGATAPIMATNMTVGMALWMRYRGHGWATVGEMAAAMYLPLAVLLVPFWIGVLPGGAMLGAMHVLMLPAMWLVIARNPDKYVHHHPASRPALAHVH
jgi:flagellar biosynthetic protein FliP